MVAATAKATLASAPLVAVDLLPDVNIAPPLVMSGAAGAVLVIGNSIRPSSALCVDAILQ